MRNFFSVLATPLSMFFIMAGVFELDFVSLVYVLCMVRDQLTAFQFILSVWICPGPGITMPP